MSKEYNKILDDVVMAQQATGRWYTPTHEYGLLKLKKLNEIGGVYSMRVDVAGNRARIYPSCNSLLSTLPLVETDLEVDAINKGINQLVSNIEDRLGIEKVDY